MKAMPAGHAGMRASHQHHPRLPAQFFADKKRCNLWLMTAYAPFGASSDRVCQNQ